MFFVNVDTFSNTVDIINDFIVFLIIEWRNIQIKFFCMSSAVAEASLFTPESNVTTCEGDRTYRII